MMTVADARIYHGILQGRDHPPAAHGSSASDTDGIELPAMSLRWLNGASHAPDIVCDSSLPRDATRLFFCSDECD